jgi:hypothetical protein
MAQGDAAAGWRQQLADDLHGQRQAVHESINELIELLRNFSISNSEAHIDDVFRAP